MNLEIEREKMKFVFSRFKKGDGWQWERGQAGRRCKSGKEGERKLEVGKLERSREEKGGRSRKRGWWREGEGVEQGVWVRKE